MANTSTWKKIFVDYNPIYWVGEKLWHIILCNLQFHQHAQILSSIKHSGQLKTFVFSVGLGIATNTLLFFLTTIYTPMMIDALKMSLFGPFLFYGTLVISSMILLFTVNEFNKLWSRSMATDVYFHVAEKVHDKITQLSQIPAMTSNMDRFMQQSNTLKQNLLNGGQLEDSVSGYLSSITNTVKILTAVAALFTIPAFATPIGVLFIGAGLVVGSLLAIAADRLIITPMSKTGNAIKNLRIDYNNATDEGVRIEIKRKLDRCNRSMRRANLVKNLLRKLTGDLLPVILLIVIASLSSWFDTSVQLISVASFGILQTLSNGVSKAISQVSPDDIAKDLGTIKGTTEKPLPAALYLIGIPEEAINKMNSHSDTEKCPELESVIKKMDEFFPLRNTAPTT